jgi:hypothetical protein
LARQSIFIDTGDDDLNELMSNARLSENFLALARDLDIMEPKVPEDIYKSHLEPTRMLMCFFPSKGINACAGFATPVVYFGPTCMRQYFSWSSSPDSLKRGRG